jgi:hypothetical protein
MTGGDGLEPRLAQTMASTCKTPVVFDDPAGTLTALLPGIRHSLGRSTGPAACWAASLGLSMRGWRRTSQRGEHRSVAA